MIKKLDERYHTEVDVLNKVNEIIDIVNKLHDFKS